MTFDTFTVVERTEQPYVGRRETITMTTFNQIADTLPDVFGWLAGQRIDPAGPPFFRYRTIDMERALEVEAGVPVARQVEVSAPLIADTLPAGRYVAKTYVGHPDGLVDETARLLEWAKQQGLPWDVRDSPEGEAWGCRLELLLTDPSVEPDMNKWRTDLMFKLADG
jgi:effector-binding domain-containing protein